MSDEQKFDAEAAARGEYEVFGAADISRLVDDLEGASPAGYDEHDLNVIPLAETRHRGFSGDHLRSHDDFMENGLPQIITNTFRIELNVTNTRDTTPEDKSIAHINARVEMSNVRLQRPESMHFVRGATDLLMPSRALLENKTYGSALFVDMKCTLTAHHHDGRTTEMVDTVKNMLLNQCLPIMVRSAKCNTYGMSQEALERIEEDHTDPGGYFIVGGIENVINNMESIVFNNPSIHRNIGHNDEITRLTIISKPGDHYENSSQLIVTLHTSDMLTFIVDHDPFASIQIPFFLVFRLLGWSSDKQIIDWIIGCDASSPAATSTATNAHIIERLSAAMDAKYTLGNNAIHSHNVDDILRMIATRTARYDSAPALARADIDRDRWVNDYMYKMFDTWLLPHIGQTPAHRHEKAIYLTHLIRKLFLVEMETVPPTDRDSYADTKRAHAACICYAKAFKQQFNFIIVHALRRQLTRNCKTTQFSHISISQLLKTAIDAMAFARGMAQAITTGNKTQITVKTGYSFMNRLISQQVHRKNQTTFAALMRMISALASQSSEQSTRAKEMRQNHNSTASYLDQLQAQDTKSVGLNKGLAIGAFITESGSSVALIEILRKDIDLTDVLEITPEHTTANAKVLVNGHWIGCVPTVHAFAAKWRAHRRGGRISPYTTIDSDFLSNEVRFWIDAGRLMQPMLIVFATGEGATFRQGIKITAQHLRQLNVGTLFVSDLVKQGIIEYISAEEQTSLVLASSYKVLRANEGNELMQYTHCSIPIAAGIGVATLLCPLATHSPPARVVLAVNQYKQCCGWYNLAWPFRIDKDGFIQYHCEMPLVRTVANSYLFPNGANKCVAIMCYQSFNQDDSIDINGGAVERGSFDGVHLTLETTDLEKNEYFMKPDPVRTADMRQHANYEKLVDGYAPRGTMLYKDDIVIGKVFKYPTKNENGFEYSDRSIVYRGDETARVINVVVAKNQEGRTFTKVQLAIVRRVLIGDKFSQRNGQKGVASMITKEADMPFGRNGLIPDIVFNPFGLPSRMTVNTLLEIATGKSCAAACETKDATYYRHAILAEISAELVKHGFRADGTERLFCGITGKWIDTLIFVGPCFYQRLQKFVNDTIYAAQSGSSDPITRQPTPGKANDGSVKIGEMEKDVAMANGLTRFLHEKYHDHSNGYIDHMCKRCGKRAIVNHVQKIYRCRTCTSDADIVEVVTSWSSKLARNEFAGMGIGMRNIFEPYTFPRPLGD
jgi:DNA-directed RNA polymerase II subunit RPB2